MEHKATSAPDMNSKALLPSIGVILLLVGAFAGYLYGVSLTSTKTTTETTLVSSLSEYDQVASAYTNQILLLGSKNASAIAVRFESNASVVWEGAPGLEGCQLAGSYTGMANITTLMNIFAKYHEGNLLISNETQTIHPQELYWVVDSTFNFAGNSSAVGRFEGAVAAQDSYARFDGVWLIAREVWNITEYQEQYPVSSMNVPCHG